MGTGHHQMLDEILFAGIRTDLAASPALLGTIKRQRSALDIAAIGDGHQRVFFDDQILDRELAFGLKDLRAAFIREFLAQVWLAPPR